MLNYINFLITNLSYENLMQLKNFLIYFSGLITGVIILSLLCSLAMLKNKSTRRYDNFEDIIIFKIKDKNNKEHLIISVNSFTQAFYSMYVGLWFMLSNKKKYVLIRDKKKEKYFFIILMTIYTIILLLTIWGIIDIIKYGEYLRKYKKIKNLHIVV